MIPLVPDTWAVPDRIRKRLGTRAGRQRAMIEERHLLLILHQVPKVDDDEREARVFWRAPDGEWKATLAKGDGLAALRSHLESYQEAIHVLDDELDRSPSASGLYKIKRRATPLLRATRNMHKALQDARTGIDDKEIISLRDLAGDLERNAELVIADAQNAVDYLEVKAAEEQTVLAQRAADAQHRLNLMAALFFPATAIGSILGTNLHSGLEGRDPLLFWIVLVSAFGVGFVVRGRLTGSPVPLSK